MAHGKDEGSGVTGPLSFAPDCADLPDSEHRVLSAASRRNGVVDVARVQRLVQFGEDVVRVCLDGLVDGHFVTCTDGLYIVRHPCHHRLQSVKSPGQRSFLERDLQLGERVEDRGGKRGAPSTFRCEAGVGPTGETPEDIGKNVSKFDMTSSGGLHVVKGPHITAVLKPREIAFRYAEYFSRKTEAVLENRWICLTAAELGIMRKEFHRWLVRDHLEAKHLERMIDSFMLDVHTGAVKPGRLRLWRAFVATKSHYYEKTQFVFEDADEEEDDDDPGAAEVPRRSLVPTRAEYEARHGRLI